MKIKKIMAISLVPGLLLSLFSCINNDYDLGKDISLEISVGGNLSIPIGKTEKICLDRIIEEGDVLHAVDGKYVITKADNISENIDAIDPVVIDDFAPDFNSYTTTFEVPTQEIPQIPGLKLPDIEVAFDANINTTEHFNIHTDIPKEIKEISTVTVTDNNGEILKTSLDISITGIPEFLPQIHLVGMKLALPEILDFEIEESDEMVRIDNAIYISKTIELTQGNGFVSIPITLKGISNPIIEEGTLILTDEISIEGRVYADKQSVGLEDLSNFTISVQPELTLPTPEIRLNKVAGSIVPNVDINTSVSLSDLPDFLKEEGTSLEIKDLTLNLSVQNPIEASISTQFEITPLDENGNIINNNAVTLDMEIKGGQRSEFHISKNSPEITSGKLTSLLQSIPDRIDLKVNKIEIESNTESEAISLGKEDYNLDIDYDINVPLEFENLNIIYSDTIEDLSSDLSDITDKVKNIELSITVDNAIPLELALSIKPCDKDGNPITGISYPESLNIEAAPDDNLTVRSSNLKIILKEEREKALQELDKLCFRVEGKNADNSDITLRPDQYFILHLSVKLPDGAQMDLEDL